MTDRLKGVVVTFTEDLHESRAQSLIEAIKCLQGVSAVDLVPTGPGISDWLTRTDERNKIRAKVLSIFDVDRWT